MRLALRALTLICTTAALCTSCADAEQTHAPTVSRPGAVAAPRTTNAPPSRPRPAPVAAHESGRAKRAGLAIIDHVIDGDTIAMRSGPHVRLVQIDTPEVYGRAECGGRAASDALKRLLPPGTRVRLVADPRLDATDRYGRRLRYVFLGSRNLNLWLVQRGLAAPWYYGGDRGRFSTALDQAVAGARHLRAGAWGACPAARLDTSRSFITGPARQGVDDARQGAAQLSPPRRHRRTVIDDASRLPLAPPYPPDVNCSDLPGPVRVTAGDPHHLDRDGDGVGCE